MLLSGTSFLMYMRKSYESYRDLPLKSVYRAESDSLVSDFYLPFLARTRTYRRAVGYFSSSSLVEASRGLSGLIKNHGVMQLIIGNPLTDEDWNAIQDGNRLEALKEQLQAKLESILNSAGDSRTSNAFDLLSWMVATGAIEIKYAFCSGGMYHEKLGEFSNELNEKIVFHGSANESANALLPSKNFESIAVYPSWRHDIFSEYGSPFSEGFDRLWSNSAKNVLTVPVPSEFYKRLHGFRTNNLPPDLTLERDIIEQELIQLRSEVERPCTPAIFNGCRYAIREHQKQALERWASSDYIGIFALATGAGKTVTVLHAAARFFEQGVRFVFVVAVPYVVLAEQWSNVMSIFGMRPIRAWGSHEQWRRDLQLKLSMFRTKAVNFISVIVVNDTLCSDNFQQFIKELNPNELFFVGDECHHHGTSTVETYIPTAARYKVGLSATPWNPMEHERKRILSSLYGEVCAEYTLADAMKDGVLCPYNYRVVFVSFDDDEELEYETLSKQIAALLAQYLATRDSEYKVRLEATAGRRLRLVGSVRDKYRQLGVLVRSLSNRVQHSLIYAGEGEHVLDQSSTDNPRNIDKVTRILADQNIKVSRITASESQSERQRILEAFQSHQIDVIAAIKVLDEGFDIPGCKSAFILASSTSQRQYIQRRGRVLRPAQNKGAAEIYDFIAVPSAAAWNRSAGCWRRYLVAEFARVTDFFDLALNNSDITEVEQRFSSFGDLRSESFSEFEEGF